MTLQSSNALPILDYPRELYAGALHYRSPACVFAFTALIAFGVGCFWVSGQAGAPPVVLMLFKWMGALLWLAAAWGGVLIATDSRQSFFITTAGVQIHRKFIPWSKIRRVGANGKAAGRSVKLFITLELAAGFTSNRELPTSKSVTPAEYEKLVAMLKTELSASNPDLEIGGYFAVET